MTTDSDSRRVSRPQARQNSGDGSLPRGRPESRTAPLTDQLVDPASPIVTEALTRRCDLCGAPVGHLCVKRGGFKADLTGRLIHLGRMQKP